MMLRSSRKPPLAKSPMRLRPPRRAAVLTDNNTNTPPGLTKSLLPNCFWDAEKSNLGPEYNTISCELRALAKRVHQNLKSDDSNSTECGAFAMKTSPLFERGRFYEVYCERRNERLKRKKCELEEPSDDLGVRAESAKPRVRAHKLDSGRKAAANATPLAEHTPRYLLRSSTRKENKTKPPLPLDGFEKSVGITTRRGGARSTRKA